MKEPWFWREKGLAAATASALVVPASIIYDSAQRLRAATTKPHKASAPVICVGNATLGGVGKTPMALAIWKLMRARGIDAHFASRGYGGFMKGPIRVLPQHTADEVGDEPLLLAAEAPTWVSKDRAAGVLAAAQCADIVIMDDGFQNPTVVKDFSILLISTRDPDGNGKVFPAGPLREPIARARSRADAIVFVGDGEIDIETSGTPAFRAVRKMALESPLSRAIAFCGIADPRRFFSELENAGVTLIAKIPFADHHFYSPAEISSLRQTAKRHGAMLITTEKDFVRLSPDARNDIAIAKLEMSVDQPDAFVDLIFSTIGMVG